MLSRPRVLKPGQECNLCRMEPGQEYLVTSLDAKQWDRYRRQSKNGMPRQPHAPAPADFLVFSGKPLCIVNAIAFETPLLFFSTKMPPGG